MVGVVVGEEGIEVEVVVAGGDALDGPEAVQPV